MAPSASANNAIGALGGAVLAACLAPQLWKLYKTRSAGDLSYLYLFLYNTGLALTFVYLYYEEAVAGWACMLVELACCILLLAAKWYLDCWGPYSARGLEHSRLNSKPTCSPSLAEEIRIDVKEFASGHAAPFPLLRPAPDHAAQHLLIDARLALPGTPAATAAAAAAGIGRGLSTAGSREGSRRSGKGGSMHEGSVGRQQRLAVSLTADGSGRGRTAAARALSAAAAANGSEHKGQLALAAGGEGDVEIAAPAHVVDEKFKSDAASSCGVMAAVGDMLEAALGSAGVPVQRRQGQSFPSFRLGQQAQQADQEQQGEKQWQGLGEEEAPDMLFLSCRDGYATALFYPGTATLSLDLLATSDAAVVSMGQAGQALCQQLLARWPGTRVAAGSVARLPRL